MFMENIIDPKTGKMKGCDNCKHYNNDGISCKAFKVIPIEIISGEFSHTKKHPEQKNDIVFEWNVTQK